MRPITEVLAEFAPGAPDLLASSFDGEADLAFAVELPDPFELGPSPEAAAREALIAEVNAVAQADCAGRLEAMAQTHAAALAEARARWAADEGAALAALLADGLARVETAIAASLAAALLPVLDEAVRARAAAEVADAVRCLLAGAHGEVIEVRGAPDLMAPVRLAFADHPAVNVGDADLPEVSINAGESVVASQIELWRERLHQALETTA